MSNSQTNLQIIANYATFLVNNRRKPSSEDQKGTCPNGQVPFIISESLITPRRLPARRLTDVDYHKYMNLFFYNIVDNMYKFKITHAGKVERSNNNVKIAKNPMSFEK